MKLAYHIDQLIAIESEAGYFDLHNCYQVVGAHQVGTRCYIGFDKDVGDWVKAEDPAHLTLVFEQVTFFQLSHGLQFPAWLEHIGFKEPEELDVEWLMEEPGAGPVHMVLGLGDEAFIRIGAATSFCLIGLPV